MLFIKSTTPCSWNKPTIKNNKKNYLIYSQVYDKTTDVPRQEIQEVAQSQQSHKKQSNKQFCASFEIELITQNK